MPRAKSGPPGNRKHRKVLNRAKGFVGSRGNLYRTASTSVIKALQHAYVGRKLKKQQYRQLWIVRIGAAARLNGMSYSRFMNGLSKSGIELNRKVLAHLAAHDAPAFADLVEVAKNAQTEPKSAEA